MAEPNWPPIKARFEKGEHPDDLAKAFRVLASTIRNKAKRDGWDRSMQRRRKPKPLPPRTHARESQPARSPAREQVADAITAVTASMSVEGVDTSAYEDQHRDDFQSLRAVAVTLLKNLGSLGAQDQARQLAAISTALKTVQDGQRKCLGLDKKAEEKPAESEQRTMILLPPDSQDWRAYVNEAAADSENGTDSVGT